MTEEKLSIISTFTILVPLIFGLFSAKKSGTLIRIFILFFLIGFIADAGTWYLINIGREVVAKSLFYVYVLIEPVWFIYFTCQFLQLKKNWLLIIELIVLAFWIIAHINLQNFTWLDPTVTDTFSMGFSMLISALSGYALLRFSQKPQTMLYRPEFWFLLAIFVYCFTTFFLNEYILSELLHKIWYLHNTMNIICYFIFSYGFYVSISKRSLIEK